MNEELKQILQAAALQGKSQEELEYIAHAYFDMQESQAPQIEPTGVLSSDSLDQGGMYNLTPGGFQPSDAPFIPAKDQGLSSFGTVAGAYLEHQVPAMGHTLEMAGTPQIQGDEITGREAKSIARQQFREKLGNAVEAFNYHWKNGNIMDAIKSVAKADVWKQGDKEIEEYIKQKEQDLPTYKQELKERKLEHYQKAKAGQEAYQQATERVPQSTEEAYAYDNYAGYIAGVLGQSAVQLPLALVTRGNSSTLMEYAEIYDRQLEKIAKDNDITVEEVIERGLDEASAGALGALAAGYLDRVGLDVLLKNFGKDAIKNVIRTGSKYEAAKAIGASMVKSGVTEAITEGGQAVVEDVSSSLAAGRGLGQSIQDVDLHGVKESAIAGGITGGVFGGAGTTARSTVAVLQGGTENQTKSTPGSTKINLEGELNNAINSVNPAAQNSPAAPAQATTPEERFNSLVGDVVNILNQAKEDTKTGNQTVVAETSEEVAPAIPAVSSSTVSTAEHTTPDTTVEPNPTTTNEIQEGQAQPAPEVAPQAVEATEAQTPVLQSEAEQVTPDTTVQPGTIESAQPSTTTQSEPTASSPVSDQVETAPKKKRGRPTKSANGLAKSQSPTEQAPATPPKKRGRPKKVATAETEVQKTEQPTKKAETKTKKAVSEVDERNDIVKRLRNAIAFPRPKERARRVQLVIDKINQTADPNRYESELKQANKVLEDIALSKEEKVEKAAKVAQKRATSAKITGAKKEAIAPIEEKIKAKQAEISELSDKPTENKEKIKEIRKEISALKLERVDVLKNFDKVKDEKQLAEAEAKLQEDMEKADRAEQYAQKVEEKEKANEFTKQKDEILIRYNRALANFEGTKKKESLLAELNLLRLREWKRKHNVTEDISLEEAVKRGFKETTEKRAEQLANSEAITKAVKKAEQDRVFQNRREKAKTKRSPNSVIGKFEEALQNPDATIKKLSIGNSPESKHWDGLEEMSEQELMDKLAKNSPDVAAWGPIYDGMMKIIKAAYGSGLKFLKGDSNHDVAGVVVLEKDAAYLVLDKKSTLKRSTQHELIHLFDFALSYLTAMNEKASHVIRGSYWKAVNETYKDLMLEVVDKASEMKAYFVAAEMKGLSSEKAIAAMPENYKRLFYFLTQSALNFEAEAESVARTDMNNYDLYTIQLVLDKIINDVEKTAVRRRPVKDMIYGLTDRHEMVAEAMSNPYFAGLLASLGRKSNNQPKVNLLKRLLDAVTGMVNSVIKVINNTLGNRLKPIDNIDDTYLSYLIQEMDAAISSVSDMIDNSVPFREATQLGKMELRAALKNEGNATSQIAKKIIDEAITRDLKDMDEVKKLVAQVEKAGNIKLSPQAKAAITRRFKTHLNNVNMFKQIPEFVKKAKDSNRYMNDTAFRDFIVDLESLDMSKYDNKAKEGVVKSIVNMIDPKATPSMKKAATNWVQQAKAKQNIDLLLDPKEGLGFQEFNKTLKKYTAFRTMLTSMAKFNRTKSRLLNSIFHDPIARGHKEAQIRTETIMRDLSEIAVEGKEQLTEKNFNRIYFYGVLTRKQKIGDKELTLEEKIANERQSLANKMKAIKDGYLKHQKEKDVKLAKEALEEVVKAFSSGKVLTPHEQKYYDTVRIHLNDVLDDIKGTKEAVRGEKFVAEEDFIPMQPMGAIPVDGVSVNTSDKKVLIEELEGNDVSPDLLVNGESSHTKLRRGGKGVYYDTNIHTVMSKYLHSVHFDTQLAYQVRVLNKMLSGKNKDRLVDGENGIGKQNFDFILDGLKRALVVGERANFDFNAVEKTILQAKRLLQSAKIGTSGQFATQYVAMLPATVFKTNPKAAAKALKFQSKLVFDKEARDAFMNNLRAWSSNMSIRDFFFERYESAEDRAKSGVANRAKRTADVIEKTTVTKLMSLADKGAVQLTWMASMIEQGADIANPKTWTKEMVQNADIATEQLQNVHTTIFAPEALQLTNEEKVFITSFFYAFKSFAMHNMMEAWLSLPHLHRSKDARKNLASIAASALFYEIVANGIAGVYGAAANLFVPGEAEEKEDEGKPGFTADVLTNAAYSLFFGGFNSLLDSLLRFTANKTVMPALFAETDVLGRKSFDQFKNSPLYGPKTKEEAFFKMTGLFSDSIDALLSGVVHAASTFTEQGELSPGKVYDMNTKFLTEGISLVPYIPFRGDIAKAVRKGRQENKRRLNESGEFRRRSRERKWAKRGQIVR